MTTKITINPNGPLKVEGDFSIAKADGTTVEHKGETAHLCRCGHSSNKPFCDGSHAKTGFKAD
jgi:CDGSH-type Zn-finger protein